jgi:hypothetical protein
MFSFFKSLFTRPDSRLGKIEHYRLELKDRQAFSEAKALEFDGALFYKSQFHYANMFDTFTEVIEFFRTSTGQYVLHWPSTGQMLVRPTAKMLVDTISSFGLTPRHKKDLSEADDAIKDFFWQETHSI